MKRRSYAASPSKPSLTCKTTYYPKHKPLFYKKLDVRNVVIWLRNLSLIRAGVKLRVVERALEPARHSVVCRCRPRAGQVHGDGTPSPVTRDASLDAKRAAQHREGAQRVHELGDGVGDVLKRLLNLVPEERLDLHHTGADVASRVCC